MTRPVERVRSAGSGCGGRALPCRPWGSVVGVDVGYAVSVSSGRGGVDPGMGEGELVLEGMAGCHGDSDAADRPADLGAVLEQGEVDAAERRLGELGVRQA